MPSEPITARAVPDVLSVFASAGALGSPVRHYELPEIVRVAAPAYVKFAPSLYPSGHHLERLAVETARERVRRAAIGFVHAEALLPEAETY